MKVSITYWILIIASVVGKECVAQNDGVKYYTNPIIHADYSDPDVIRVGNDYYMTSSSFSHFPGLPILHSKDLVHWTIIGHAALSYPDPVFKTPQHGNAIWAPSLRHHNGVFYIYFGDPDRGVFMTTAFDPKGPWTPLQLIKKVTGWIDTCPFWDEDGKAYLVHAYANSRVGLKSVLLMNEMSQDGREILGTSTIVFNDPQRHNTIEGPKLYKRNGYYYIFAPAGGVATGWQTVLRSKNIFGPYEDKIVLEQGTTKINGPHQGGWVTAQDGRDWFVHFQDKGAYGRIIHLQPMTWHDDWPVIGKDFDGNGIGEPVSAFSMPNQVVDTSRLQTSDDFNTKTLGLQWQWQANVDTQWYSLRNGKLILHSIPKVNDVNFWMQPNMMLQKFPASDFSVKTKLALHSTHMGDQAGLIIFGLDYAYIAIEKFDSDQYNIKVIECKQAEKERPEYPISETVTISDDEIYLGVKVTSKEIEGEVIPKAFCSFLYSLDGNTYSKIGTEFIAKEGKWVGAKVGLFTTGSTDSYVEAEYFKVKNEE